MAAAPVTEFASSIQAAAEYGDEALEIRSLGNGIEIRAVLGDVLAEID